MVFGKSLQTSQMVWICQVHRQRWEKDHDKEITKDKVEINPKKKNETLESFLIEYEKERQRLPHVYLDMMEP